MKDNEKPVVYLIPREQGGETCPDERLHDVSEDGLCRYCRPKGGQPTTN